MTRFIGRRQEIADLKRLMRKKSASLAVIKGRRRIGKTRLAEEFGADFTKHYFFSGLAPSQAPTATMQRNEFLRQMQRQGIPSLFGPDDWGHLFDDVGDACNRGKILVVLDEISWMGHRDPTFLAKLKNTWDLKFKKNPHLILIISGSNSTWIQKNLLSDTGFVGRISHRLTLEELPLEECNKFWDKQVDYVSSFEKLKLLSITGGVPRYLEEIDPTESAEQNIQRMCFERNGLLFHEFEEIFADSLSTKSEHYKTILHRLAEGSATQAEIARSLGRKRSGGGLIDYLNDLCNVGFVTCDSSWNLSGDSKVRTKLYRLSDNYIRFYLKQIEPNQNRIINDTMRSLPLGWDSIIALQFENLVLSRDNRLKLYELLDLPLDSILHANPYLQTETTRRNGCQIDFLIQAKEGSLYVCEIKFKKEPLNGSVIREMKEKIQRLKRKRSMSCRPVLIHVNGVSESVEQSDYFVKVIDFSDFL